MLTIVNMIRQELDIKNYDWHVVVYYAIDCYYKDKILEELKAIGCNDDFARKAYKSMKECELDTGYSNLRRRKSLMVINRTSTEAEFDNSLNHERQHLLMHIAQEYEIDVYDEELCYLAGDVAMSMHPVTKNLTSTCGCHDHDVSYMMHKTKKDCKCL